jgi:hypothetical protein
VMRLAERFISHACKYPAEPQAEIMRGHRGRRHPFEGSRPEWSGYCVPNRCNCKCHVTAGK